MTVVTAADSPRDQLLISAGASHALLALVLGALRTGVLRVLGLADG
jgi:hypothetical protein